MLAPKEKMFVRDWYYERFRGGKEARSSHQQLRKDVADEIRQLRKELNAGTITREQFDYYLKQARSPISASYEHHTGGSSLEEAYTSQRERMKAGGRTQEINRYSTSSNPSMSFQPLDVPADKAVTSPSPNSSATTPTNNTKGSGNSKPKIYRSNKKMTTMGKVGVGAAAALGIGGSILAYQHYKNKKK